MGSEMCIRDSRRGRGVLLVVGVQDEDLVEGVSQHRIDLVILAGHREAHVQEVLGKGERVLRVHEGLADGVFEAIAASVGTFAIMRIEAIMRCRGSLMSVES